MKPAGASSRWVKPCRNISTPASAQPRSIACAAACGVISAGILNSLPAVSGVSTKPGATALTRMPLGPSSRLQVLVKPITPNLLAA